MMVTKKNKSIIYTKIILGIFGICVTFFFIGVVLYLLLNSQYPEGKNEIISIYAAVVGGLCTLFGVILTIAFTETTRAKDFKYDHSPRLFMPTKYDISKATRFRVYLNDNQIEEIPNHIMYFQNTDKVEFVITSICYNNSQYKCNPHFVNKNELFSICFYSKDHCDTLYINIESLDGTKYNARVSIDKNHVFIEEKK